MSELSGSELRRAAWEALGWRYATRTNFDVETRCWHAPGCEYAASGFVITSAACKIGCGETVLPAIESDPAVSEPMFLEWCEKNDFWFTIDSCHTGHNNYFAVRLDKKGEQRHGPVVYGSTPSEARARAIVAASQMKA